MKQPTHDHQISAARSRKVPQFLGISPLVRTERIMRFGRAEDIQKKSGKYAMKNVNEHRPTEAAGPSAPCREEDTRSTNFELAPARALDGGARLDCRRQLAAVDRAAAKYIPTARDEEFRSFLDRIIARDPRGYQIASPRKDAGTGDINGLAVIEEAGGGKSTLIEAGLSNHPLLQPQYAGHCPVVRVHAPSATTTKSLLIQILIDSGYHDVNTKKSEQMLVHMVKNRMQALGVVVIWIDEAHDLFGGGTNHQIQITLKSLKKLMQSDGAVSVILSGIETLWKLASCDQQISRRFYKYQLEPISAVSDAKLLRLIMRTLCAEVGVSAPSDDDLLPRLVHASRKRFGRYIETILAALETAVLEGATQLDIRHFAQAWRLREGCPIGQNVFLADRWSQIDLGANAKAH